MFVVFIKFMPFGQFDVAYLNITPVNTLAHSMTLWAMVLGLFYIFPLLFRWIYHFAVRSFALIGDVCRCGCFHFVCVIQLNFERYGKLEIYTRLKKWLCHMVWFSNVIKCTQLKIRPTYFRMIAKWKLRIANCELRIAAWNKIFNRFPFWVHGDFQFPWFLVAFWISME